MEQFHETPQTHRPMVIVINGKPQVLPDGISVSALLGELGITDKHIAVEVNRELVPRQAHSTRILSEGDSLEVVTLVGGG